MAFASSTTPITPPTLQDEVAAIAIEHNIPAEWLQNMVKSESGGDPTAVGDKGCSYGLVQINICANDDPRKPDYATKNEALDPHWALEYAAQHLEDGTEYIWSSCNCFSLVWTKIANLPHMVAIVPNTTMPKKGDVAIFYYTDKETGLQVKHIAYVMSADRDTVTIQEANKDKCLIDTRTVSKTDPHLSGFWHKV